MNFESLLTACRSCVKLAESEQDELELPFWAELADATIPVVTPIAMTIKGTSRIASLLREDASLFFPNDANAAAYRVVSYKYYNQPMLESLDFPKREPSAFETVLATSVK